MLTSTQLFAAFIENRSFVSFTGDYGGETSGKAASLVFFDECIDRLRGEYTNNVRLIDSDDALSSERTIIILPPEDKGSSTDEGYMYTTFPQLQDELFALPDEDADKTADADSNESIKKRRRSATFMIGKRTKQELKVSLKQAKLCCRNATMWARLLLSNAYCVWFGCLLDYSRHCHSKASILRYGLDVLHLLRDAGCIPLPDETSYRILMHLCCLYTKPVLAMRVFQFLRDSGTQLSAVTYGLYNKALLECSWPSSDRDGYMLWQKLKNVFYVTVYLRRAIQRRQTNGSVSGSGSDLRSEGDSSSQKSMEKIQNQIQMWSSRHGNRLEEEKSTEATLDDEKSTTGSQSAGDNSSSVSLDMKIEEQPSSPFGIAKHQTDNNPSETGTLDNTTSEALDEDDSEVTQMPRSHSNSIVKTIASPGEKDSVGSSPENRTKKTLGKLEIERQDITHLALDPLSPPPKMTNPLLDIKTEEESTNKPPQNHKEEILSLQASDADSSTEKFSSLNDVSFDKESGDANVNSQTSTPTNSSKKRGHAGLLRRSFSFAPGSSFSENIWSSGSKINNLLKTTTIGVASRAKKLAANLAKDINETVQTNLSYYTPEKFKGSLGSLSELAHDGGHTEARLRRDDDLSGSQTSLLSYNDKSSSRGSAKMNAGSSGSTLGASRPTLAMSSSSLNTKAAIEMDITMSSCSRCPRCRCLVYDEEIMAGWMADESNLNTHCPFCNTLFVPRLNIYLKNYKDKSEIGSFDSVTSAPSVSRQNSLNVPEGNNRSINRNSFHELDPVSVPYLSPLVLRKELESLLENEGMTILGEPEFVDNHPIVYWNFVWYFRRLSLQSNLYNLILESKIVNTSQKSQKDQTTDSKKYGERVSVHTMWDNVAMHKDMAEPPLYLAYLQMKSHPSGLQQNPYADLFESIKNSIMADDVRTPLLALLEQNSTERMPRRSVYREILFFIVVALGKDSIDVDAFDQAYRRTYDELTVADLERTANCDRPPTNHTHDCRAMFRELDLPEWTKITEA